jgi:nitroreductase
MPRVLGLTVDEVLSTTRAVRRRLDLERPVERELVEECLRLAQQAPTGNVGEDWHFVVVTDPARKKGLADLYRRAVESYFESTGRSLDEVATRTGSSSNMQRYSDGIRRLLDHLHEVPVHVVSCIEGRTDGLPSRDQVAKWASVIQATWSYMLAARARGLGTVWTSVHLLYEREAAELLGIPYDEVMQVALIPTAYTLGTDFRPAKRKPLETMVHWERW